MIRLSEMSFPELEHEAHAAGLSLPLEQTGTWAAYEATIEGRSTWGAFAIEDANATLGYVSFADYLTHGYHYLRSHHGPVWVAPLGEGEEREALLGLADAIRKRDAKQVFARMAIAHEHDFVSPTLSTVPYDQTVVIDLAGGDEAILSRMKPRGRRDVRKSLRESPVECADETEGALASFADCYDVMVETGRRDGFTPAPITDYEDMIRLLGPDHCRVYVGRNDGRAVCWSIVTLNDDLAVRYYAASRTDSMRQHVGDKLVYFECCDLAANKGIERYDLMGIGSDFAPSLKGLNEFKCKFTKEITPVVPDRDLPLHKFAYKTLVASRKIIRR